MHAPWPSHTVDTKKGRASRAASRADVTRKGVHATGRLSGKVALVTGAGAGIGQGCALHLAEQGATVVGCDIDAAASERTRREAADRGPTVEVLAPYDMRSRPTRGASPTRRTSGTGGSTSW
ncbi:SDR family NAD(P)-dependent oxidoreductase [Streptomyces sp. NBC_00582]|uniref:SDR family NAD(P)-dependent oxidoreductase n=1 Tax=Streptomyces sp. NBC_00582 TaxID=2975783 RepID=UPI002E81DB45|nr:SDR family NAD(P)-dependent oxidoreductase [Streptomyces sp. NBC_00582]